MDCGTGESAHTGEDEYPDPHHAGGDQESVESSEPERETDLLHRGRKGEVDRALQTVHGPGHLLGSLARHQRDGSIQGDHERAVGAGEMEEDQRSRGRGATPAGSDERTAEAGTANAPDIPWTNDGGKVQQQKRQQQQQPRRQQQQQQQRRGRLQQQQQ